MKVKKFLRGPWIWVALALTVVFIGTSLATADRFTKVDTEVGLDLISSGQAKSVTILDGNQRVDVVLTSTNAEYGNQIQFYFVSGRASAVAEIVAAAPISDGWTDEVPSTPWPLALLGSLLPFIIILALFWFLMSTMSGGGRGVMNFGKSKAKMVTKETSNVTFADVAGIDEAMEELVEIKDFLKDPEKFQAMGAKIPKGVLLYGPPGTGKTLVAKAVAGEAGVPFFSISGSDFVEMFVGVGASRVRDLFEQAKQASPAIIFVDEIDAVGRHRGTGIGGGNDEREQTLNQLLVEMDGFDTNTNVILIAATNRPDVLDPALLRPGRFDRQVGVSAPDLKGREQILKVHSKNKPLADDVNLEVIARRTPGFTGADLANVLNESALLAARLNRTEINDEVIDEAIDRVIGGPQKKSTLMQDKERLITAYHEAGHGLVAGALNHSDPVTKITILPRGRALGYTMVMPMEDRYSITRNQLLDQIAWAMGGRIAEEIVFKDPTTGASNDFEKATNIARTMVTKYGMSSKIGAITLGSGNSEPFLGRELATQHAYSNEMAQQVDNEVRAILENALNEAHQAITLNRAVLDKLAKSLLEQETLNQEEIMKIFKTVKKLPERTVWRSSTKRSVTAKGPISVPKRKAIQLEVHPEKPKPEKPTEETPLDAK
ncbi:ATP-dependent zinc metalloprotease FtsH [Candidatus Aquiluna sp. UB-MaderosW2red]|uniref:ATP-dependent zinc metalloprotease FtsH n=1 Tax=Candidatus Aquiluna sp. UB-MaderosW2red TaxID=1855377 RepID=UPI000875CF49|nr:ATP-dependent zinc metalloprotease FtsH [Candidatus Aquiluna sp. UB-MaderosW2red]SCX02795.1 cell division protease FtsH [Candidatus Aquiluna sp. UB-MaderosW2red]